MTPDTPLAAVAKFLEPRTAELLMYRDSRTQLAALVAVRAYIIKLEEINACLDPITLGASLHGMVTKLLNIKE